MVHGGRSDYPAVRVGVRGGRSRHGNLRKIQKLLGFKIS